MFRITFYRLLVFIVGMFVMRAAIAEIDSALNPNQNSKTKSVSRLK